MKPFIVIAFIITVPLSAQVTINGLPSREFGQTLLANPVTSTAPNLIEGKELNEPTSIAFDNTVTPPTVYIADFGNNRVLGWKNASSLSAGNKADVVIGQQDFSSNLPGGPGSNGNGQSTGLYLPVAVAVDGQGRLYVADGGNNRILRFPKVSTGSFPDLVIGQASFSSGNSANQGKSAPSAQTLYLSSGGTYFQTGMAFDSLGNLWVTDGGNNRVLRYPAASLAAGTQQIAADTVIGQNSFATNQPPQPPASTNAQLFLSGLLQPSSLAFDTAGNLYVSDAYARALQFPPPTPGGVGQPAARVLGVAPTPQSGCPQYPSQSTLGIINSGCSLSGSAGGVFTMGNYLFVCDTPNNRVVWYDVPGNWPAATTTVPSPQELGVLGQPSFVSAVANSGSLVPTVPNQSGLSGPTAGAANPSTHELWIVDTGNNRVMVFPAGSGSTPNYSVPASRVLGQLGYTYNSPNLIDGQEVWFFANGVGAAAMVVDKNSTPPHLYVADFYNNRILGFKDARSVGTNAQTVLSQTADLVIGQPDFKSALANYNPNNLATSGDPTQPSITGLLHPVGLAVDFNGDLYVADSGNGRVLRFPAPYVTQANGATQTANLVLGQSGFTGPLIKDASQSTMNTPFGLSFFYNNPPTAVTGLAVSDAVHNRILVFERPTGGDFSNGMQASGLIGQTSYTATLAGGSTSNLSSPRHIAVDSSNTLYVADSANNRLLAFNASARLTSGASAVFQVPGLSQPQGIVVSLATGEGWVTSTNSNVIYRFPEINTFQLTQQFTASIGSNAPIAVGLDASDNLIVGEAINRVSFYFPQMYYRHAASYAAGVNSTGNPTPGMLAEVARYALNGIGNFSFTPTPSLQNLPWQTNVNDVQIIVDGVAAPIFFLEPAVIHFQIPMATTDSGPSNWVVQTASTGEILAAGTFTMQQASPGLYTANSAGTGQIAALNYNPDGTFAGINGPGNGLTVNGGVISLWLTGQGKVSNPPPDGVAPGVTISTDTTPTVYINGFQAQVIGSVLSPQFPGVWQINAVIPPRTPPGSVVSVFVQMDGYSSNVGGNPTTQNGGPAPDLTLTGMNGLITTLTTK